VRRRIARVVLVALVAAVAYAALAVAARPPTEPTGSQFHPAVTGRFGVVATESPAAARVGRRVLEQGGNAIDAAASIVFALTAARPQSCGVGGGGFMVYRSAQGKVDSLDFRETAPAAWTPQTLQPSGLHTVYTGHLTNGVPGVVAGMDAALRRYGTFGLKRAIAPAAALARRGVRVREPLAKAMAANIARIRLFPTTARIYLKHGRPYKEGDVLRNPQLARTLSLIGRDGAKAFYDGPIAARIVADQTATAARYHDAGLMTRADLRAYKAIWRAPVRGTYRGFDITGAPPPSSGGIATLEMLNILEGFPLRAQGARSALTLHELAEAQKLAWADRNKYVADPGFVPQPTATLIDKAYAAQRRALIDPDQAAADYPPGPVPSAVPARQGGDEHAAANTTSVSVIDQRGNSVALTCTIEQEFGSAVVAPGTGFLLNNELTDFGDPGTANQPQGGKRPRSSIDPVIVSKGNRPVEVIGGAGGARIIEGVTLGIVQRIDFEQDLAHALDAPRLDAPGMEPTTIENGRISPVALAGLRARGHKLTLVGEYDLLPRVQAAGVLSSGRRQAASDPRSDFGSYAQRHRARPHHR
jgi:gamma-glutamyltranspeptidase / glutathione hydrolase